MSAITTQSPDSSVSVTELGTLPEPPMARDNGMEVQSGSDELTRTGDSSRMMSKRRAAVVVVTVAGVNFLNTMGSGILTVALPTIARSVGLGVELLLW